MLPPISPPEQPRGAAAAGSSLQSTACPSSTTGAGCSFGPFLAVPANHSIWNRILTENGPQGEKAKKMGSRVDRVRRRSSRAQNPEEEGMKFLTFVRSSESYRASSPPASLMEAMGRFVERSLKEGTLVDTGGLLPSKDGFRIRLKDGKVTVTDGPFSESKEVIGGWAIIDVASRAEALRVTTEFMELHRVHWPEFECESEVRPIEDMAE